MNTTHLIASRVEPISHREACVLAATEYGRVADVLETLQPHQWDRPTDCTGWSVRDLAGHLLGSMRSAASVREFARQQLEAMRRAKSGGQPVDHMTAVQVEATARLTQFEVVAECRALVTKAAAGRRRIPGAARRFVSVRVEMGTINERWTLGYLVDVILTRDTWMHRIDLCRAVGVTPQLTAEHDGRIVADVVAEWARRHGDPYTLDLSGPAGGRFADRNPATRDAIEIDAVQFCRVLSGRADGTGLLATAVPF